MNRFIAILALALVASAACVFAANETTVGASGSAVNSPVDMKSIVLHTRGTNAAIDTYATTTRKVFGPYNLANTPNSPMAKGFQLISDVIEGTTPVASFEYQVIAGKTIKDTVAAWVSAVGCTLGTSGINTYVDLSSNAGESIVFRVYNYDNSTTILSGLLKVYMKDNINYYKNR